MSAVNDGGTAFPMQDPQAISAYASARVAQLPEGSSADERARVYLVARAEAAGGLTVRDYFATHAYIGDVDQLSLSWGEKLLGRACPDSATPIACFQWWADYRAALRYMEADAMLKARERKGGTP